MNIIFFFLTYNEVTDNVGGICCTLLQIKYNFQQIFKNILSEKCIM